MNLWFILAVHPNQLAAKLEGRLQDAIIITQKDDLRHAQGAAGVGCAWRRISARRSEVIPSSWEPRLPFRIVNRAGYVAICADDKCVPLHEIQSVSIFLVATALRFTRQLTW
jgi:hypothetical protein